MNCLAAGSIEAANTQYTYIYADDGSLKTLSLSTEASNGTENFVYDNYGRLTSKEIKLYTSSATNNDYFKHNFTYVYNNNAINEYKSSVYGGTEITYSYNYDGKGNIVSVKQNGATKLSYEYNFVNQLTRENNVYENRTYKYYYDYAGNITKVETYNLTFATSVTGSPLSTDTYTYSTSTWGDLLVSYNGQAITYDAIGNPLTYNNGTAYNFTWDGRKLTGAYTGGINYSFTYNDEGIRTSKTRNGTTTTYYLNGSQIVAEVTNSCVTLYVYDINGLPLGMQYHDEDAPIDEWQIFWYEKNIQGDIIGVYDQAGTKLISYTYDAWGNFTESYLHSGVQYSPVSKNPFTYRGYYYDRDLGLYYLGSRYYDAKVGRFINADSALYHNLQGYNLFTYCNNNPVNYVDYTGENPLALLLNLPLLAKATLAAIGIIVAYVAISATIVGIANAVESLAEAMDGALDAKDDSPQSIPDADTPPETNVEKRENSLPTVDEPNTDKHLYDKNGLKQTRHYGPDGKAEYDIDYHHSGTKHKFPHKHNWTWENNIPTRGPAIDIY